MRTSLTIAAATAALAAGGVAAAGAATSTPVSAAALRHVEGRVTALDRSARTFTVRDAERGTLRVRVTSTTKFERVTFSALRIGTRVDVRARRSGDRWNATKVERAGVAADHHDAGDDHGGHHGGGGDDPAGHH
ncbi:MAG TPA: DUF5666 domain-containing protein [Solirubrobacteraceae bacterium]